MFLLDFNILKLLSTDADFLMHEAKLAFDLIHHPHVMKISGISGCSIHVKGGILFFLIMLLITMKMALPTQPLGLTWAKNVLSKQWNITVIKSSVKQRLLEGNIGMIGKNGPTE